MQYPCQPNEQLSIENQCVSKPFDSMQARLSSLGLHYKMQLMEWRKLGHFKPSHVNSHLEITDFQKAFSICYICGRTLSTRKKFIACPQTQLGVIVIRLTFETFAILLGLLSLILTQVQPMVIHKNKRVVGYAYMHIAYELSQMKFTVLTDGRSTT